MLQSEFATVADVRALFGSQVSTPANLANLANIGDK